MSLQGFTQTRENAGETRINLGLAELVVMERLSLGDMIQEHQQLFLSRGLS
jgi:hypothetical protein